MLAVSVETSSAIHPEAERLYRTTLQEALTDPNSENILRLADALSISKRLLNPDDPIEVGLDKEIQHGMLSIPGYAQHLADEIEKERLKYTEDELRHLAAPSFNRMRYSFIQETLVHLPSPETIEVLGNYLHDERDARPSDVPPQNWITTPANSFLAAESLSSIGLNDSPIRKGTFVDSAVVEKWRAWYDEVKSGQRSFAFQGQNVAYRFKPDGTVETTPRDASKDRSEPPVRPSQAPTAQQPSRPGWAIPVLIAVALAILAVAAKYLRRK